MVVEISLLRVLAAQKAAADLPIGPLELIPGELADEIVFWRKKFADELEARNGPLEVLRRAHELGRLWDDWAGAHAVFGGHMAVLQWQWAHERDYPWDEVPAATGGAAAADAAAGGAVGGGPR